MNRWYDNFMGSFTFAVACFRGLILLCGMIIVEICGYHYSLFKQRCLSSRVEAFRFVSKVAVI